MNYILEESGVRSQESGERKKKEGERKKKEGERRKDKRERKKKEGERRKEGERKKDIIIHIKNIILQSYICGKYKPKYDYPAEFVACGKNR